MEPVDGSGLCFALPPSLGTESSRMVARDLADVLYGVGFDTVLPTRSYAELERVLLTGEADAAWGPPLVCARVERAGGAVAFRGLRGGSTEYHAVLLGRRRDELDLERLVPPATPFLRAAWVDPWSMAGYILPRHHLRASGFDPAAVFADERTFGSYEACFEAVLDFRADVTASFSGPRGHGYIELCGPESRMLSVFAETRSCPNDGLIVCGDAAADVTERLRAAIGHRRTMEVLAISFDIDSFDEPPSGSYRDLLALL